jgi:hypothetical protein
MKNKQPFKIVCTKEYEFEDTKFKVGDIGYNSAYQPIPDNWERYSKDKCLHPIAYRSYIGNNLLKCNVCSLEFS